MFARGVFQGFDSDVRPNEKQPSLRCCCQNEGTGGTPETLDPDDDVRTLPRK